METRAPDKRANDVVSGAGNSSYAGIAGEGPGAQKQDNDKQEQRKVEPGVAAEKAHQSAAGVSSTETPKPQLGQ